MKGIKSKWMVAVMAVTAGLVTGTARTQVVSQSEESTASETIVSSRDGEAAGSLGIVFSNLDNSSSDRYNSNPYLAYPVAGRRAGIQTESWVAIAFIPKGDVQAKVLATAIGYISGTKLFNLGIYTDFNGTVGSPLPGGQGKTRQIPDLGVCCQLTKVVLPGDGVLLTGGTKYWLVATPDDVNAPDFSGAWCLSYKAQSGTTAPPSVPWYNYPGSWPATEIRGTRVQGANRVGPITDDTVVFEPTAGGAKIKIFSNLGPGPISNNRYAYGAGGAVTGSNVATQPEVWQALPFTPKADVHATTLAAAIAWISGTKKVNLGLYSDNGGTVGTPIPGGQGSTTEIPTLGDCCAMTLVKLAAPGVALTAGSQYWLVATSDDVNAPDFHGAWQDSSFAESAYQDPKIYPYWTSFSGDWFAAEIRGTSP